MKIVKMLLISFCIIITLSQNVFAIDTIFDTAEKWTDLGHDEAGTGFDSTQLQGASQFLYSTLLTIATVVAVIVGGMLGIQYMTAGISKKVEVKESLFPYIISCIVVFGSLGIWKLVVSILENI